MKGFAIFVYADALNANFILSKVMPFLCSLANKDNYRQLENVVGYSFAIQSTMLSGRFPEESNHWLPYFYSPQSSMVLTSLKKAGSIFMLDKVPYLRYMAIKLAFSFFNKKGVKVKNVPLSEIDSFFFYPYYYMCDLPFYQELEELLKEKYHVALSYIGPPHVRNNFYASVLNKIKNVDSRHLTILYDDTLDGLGHRYGPFSSECYSYARNLDNALSIVYKKLVNIFGSHFTFIVFSDHGQHNLSNQMDLVSYLKKHNLKFIDDYLCFIDATLALFWPKNEKAQEQLIKVLQLLKIGTLIDERLKEKYHLRFKNNKLYGNLVYVLTPGWSFFPNFFSPFSPLLGLHGYLPEELVQKAFLISNKKINPNISHVKDIKNLFLEISTQY